jgi:steroid delta-isomerase-like uncharacterized protein
VQAPSTDQVRQVPDARRLLLAYFDSVLNGKRIDEMDQIFASDVAYHSAGSPDIHGFAALKEWVRDYLEAVPDYHATFQATIAEGDKCMLRWSCTGTHQGTLLGFPATGKRFTMTGMTVFRVAGGRVVEGWIERDSLGLFRQLQASV